MNIFFTIVPCIIFIILGMFMFLNPKKATRKGLENDEKEVKRIKKNGLIISIISVIAFIIFIFLLGKV